MAYHAAPGLVKSGFSGVDAFFVISGFLITQIVARELQEDRFNLVDFYARRIRRIFPALLVTLAATLAIGWRTLFSSEFDQLGKHVAGGAAFVSNIVLYLEAGYFDYGSHTKPLLHLWSLGVEEQFYLLWPILLLTAARFARRLGPALLVIALASFAANVLMIAGSSAAVFYLPLFRFWELAGGGLLAVLLPTQPPGPARWRDGLGIAGLLLMLAGLLLVEDRARYPGWYALLPTLGTMLVIAAGPAGLTNRLLALRPLVAIGLISYPLYLWHWPLLTFATILDGPLPSRTTRAVLVLVSFGLAALTYRWIEQPLRGALRVRPIAATLAAAMLVVGMAGYAAHATGGAPFREAARAAEPYISSMARSPRLGECIDIVDAHRRPDSWYCHLNPSGAPADTMVFGDSHAFALLPAFEEIARANRKDILFTAYSGCPPLLGVATPQSAGSIFDCAALNERVFQFVASGQVQKLFLIANWTYYTDGNYQGDNLSVIAHGDTPPTRDGSRLAFERGLDETQRRYAALPVTLTFVQRVPAQLEPAVDLIRKVVTAGASAADTIARVSAPLDAHRQLLRFVSASFAAHGVGTRPRSGLIDLADVYCRDGTCAFGAPGESWYFDDSHLSARGALRAVPALADRAAR